MTTWQDISARLAGAERGTQSALARFLDMDASYLSRKLKTRDPLTVSEARKAQQWLESMDLPDYEPPAQPAESQSRKLRVFGYAATSDGDRIAIASDRILDMMEIPAELDPSTHFVILPIGSSMEPRIFAGEPQVVRRNYPPGRDRLVLIEFNDGTGVIKSYRGQKDGRVFVEQYNPPKTLDYDASTVKALHAIVLRL